MPERIRIAARETCISSGYLRKPHDPDGMVVLALATAAGVEAAHWSLTEEYGEAALRACWEELQDAYDDTVDEIECPWEGEQEGDEGT